MKFDTGTLVKIGFMKRVSLVNGFVTYHSVENKGDSNISVKFAPSCEGLHGGGWSISQGPNYSFAINPPKSYGQLYHLLSGLGIKFTKQHGDLVG